MGKPGTCHEECPQGAHIGIVVIPSTRKDIDNKPKSVKQKQKRRLKFLSIPSESERRSLRNQILFPQRDVRQTCFAAGKKKKCGKNCVCCVFI